MAAPSAYASGAIYVSDTGDVGWCTGRRGQINARNCALEYCKQQSNGTCELALDCAGGWGAIAFGPKSGYGMMCQSRNEALVRLVALVACIRATKDKCYTTDTFSERGVTASKDENKAFDDIFYAQIMMSKLGYLVSAFDGAVGPATQANLIKYQQSTQGLPVSGLADVATLTSLTKAVGGTSGLVEFILATTEHLINPSWGAKSWAGTPVQQSETPVQPIEKKALLNPPQAVETFGLTDKELDSHFNEAFSSSGEFKAAAPSACGKAAAEGPYTCTAKADGGSGQNSSTLTLDLFGSKAAANEDSLAKAKAYGAAYDGKLYKATYSYTVQRKDSPSIQNYDGICYQTLGAKNSPAICFLYLTPRVAISAFVPPSQATSLNVTIDVKRPISPDVATAKSLLFGGLSAFAIVKLPN